MSQFTSGFWDVYIAALTILSVVACGVLLKMQSDRKVPGGKAETTGHTWDGDLGEYNNPLPRWWMWLFYITIAFALVYLYLYPGLGSYAGSLGWTQVGQLEEENAAAEKEFGPIFQKFAAQDLKVLAADPAARAVGQKLFLNNCAQCHASDGGGSKGFPNLTDSDWLYGGDPEVIKASITAGRARDQGRRALRDVPVGHGQRQPAHGPREGCLCPDLCRLPWLPGQGQPIAGRAEPHGQDVALRIG